MSYTEKQPGDCISDKDMAEITRRLNISCDCSGSTSLSGNNGVYRGPTPPEDTSLIWYDTGSDGLGNGKIKVYDETTGTWTDGQSAFPAIPFLLDSVNNLIKEDSATGAWVTRIEDINQNASPSEDADNILNSSNGIYLSADQVFEALCEKIHPIGSTWITAVSTQNPNNIFCGVWNKTAQGRCIIGTGTGTDDRGEIKTFTSGNTGGEFDHVLTLVETPLTPNAITTAASGTIQQDTVQQDGDPSDPHNNLPPYVAMDIWTRIS